VKTWKGKIVRRKILDQGQLDIAGIALTNPKENALSFTSNARALILVIDVMWGDTIEHFVPIDELIICKS
jgi:hypothetical protein